VSGFQVILVHDLADHQRDNPLDIGVFEIEHDARRPFLGLEPLAEILDVENPALGQVQKLKITLYRGALDPVVR